MSPPAQRMALSPALRCAADARLFLGGEDFWRTGRKPKAIQSRLPHNGLSPLLPHGHDAEVDQLTPVSGGVVALIGDISAGITYDARPRSVHSSSERSSPGHRPGNGDRGCT